MKQLTRHIDFRLPQALFGLIAASALLAASIPAHAAKSWGITGEVEGIFTATVVDITCELTGDCPANCGEGSRQLALKTADQGTILVAKNLTFYTGASYELYEFCGQEVEVDGLFTENRNVRFFQVQKMRPVGGKWEKADRFLDAYAEANDTTARKAKKWYKTDPQVQEIIERDGYLGQGPAKDAEYFNQ